MIVERLVVAALRLQDAQGAVCELTAALVHFLDAAVSNASGAHRDALAAVREEVKAREARFLAGGSWSP